MSSTGTTRVLRMGDSLMVGMATTDASAAALQSELEARLSGPFWYAGTVDGKHGAHDGHGGWTTKRLLDNAVGILAKTSPDLVLLQIGTNDVVGKTSRSAFGQTLRELLRLITNGWADDGGATGAVLGTLGPLTYPDKDAQARARDLNAEIASVAGELRAEGRGVVVAPVDSFVPSSELSDGVHFTPKGYAAMARAFASVLGSAPSSRDAGGGGAVVALALAGVLWLILRR